MVYFESRKVVQISKQNPVIFTVFFPRKIIQIIDHKGSGNVAGM